MADSIYHIYKGKALYVNNFTGDNSSLQNAVNAFLSEIQSLGDENDWGIEFQIIPRSLEIYKDEFDDVDFSKGNGITSYDLGETYCYDGDEAQWHRPMPGESFSLDITNVELEEYTNYNYKGFLMCFSSYDGVRGDMTCWFFEYINYHRQFTGEWGSEFPSDTVCILPVYSHDTNFPTLQYTSPIVVNRYPLITNTTIKHHITIDSGHEDNDLDKNCINQLQFLKLVTSTNKDEEDNGIYANNEYDSLEGPDVEHQKIIKVPANTYLNNQDYGMRITPINPSISDPIVIRPNEESINLSNEWIIDDMLSFKVDLNKESSDTFIEIGDTTSYKFVGICVMYTSAIFRQAFTLDNNDKCFFIARKYTDNKEVDYENNYDFKILYNTGDDNSIGTSGHVYVTPVFEAQREVYLTNPIIVNEFPDFVNEGKNGDNNVKITKDTTYNKFTDFGYTVGSIDVGLFRGNYVDTTTDQFNSTIFGDAGFVELFGTWNGYDGDNWKQNMQSSTAYNEQCELSFNEKSYEELGEGPRYTELHPTYINTAELDNDSLYLTISGSCSGLEGLGTVSNEQTIQDRQIIHNGYEMIGFVVYFKNGSNDLSNIENWPIPNNIINEYSSYFVPLEWSYDNNANFNARIKIDFSGSDFESLDENQLYNNLFENYLAISPVYLEVDKKTITISEALDKDNNPLNALTADENYKFSCDNGNEYGYNDTISVQSDDTLEFTCELTNTEVIYDSTTNSYSQYTLERIEVVDSDGNLVKYSNDNNPTIKITYDDFDDLNDLYIHPIYSYKPQESTNYKINNDTCREIELSIYADDEYSGSDYYINGNLTNSITIKEWSDLEVAIYPSLPDSLSLKISRIKDTNGWSYFLKDLSNTKSKTAFDIDESGSIYASIDNEDVINNIDYSADIYMKVSRQDLDVYHMSFLNGKLNFNTSVEDKVYVHCWCDKDNLQPNEPIGSYVNTDLDHTAKKNLALRGVLPINYDFYSYSRNKTIKSINTKTTHIINTSNNKCPGDDPFINISLFPNTNETLYYVDKGSHFVDLYEETNPFTNNDAGLERYPGYSEDDNNWTKYTKDWIYEGNGVYYFIVDLSNFNTSDVTTFDYETYACGPLIGYVNEREDDNTNAVILKENDFFIGVIEPGEDSVTVYGYDTVDSEQYLMTHNEEGTYNGPYIINITDGDILDSIREINYLGENQIMPNDYCQYQTGNQFVMFRLRNPYNGKVLNYDDSYSYSTLTNAEVADDALNDDYLNSTHEQTGFLTLWEQRSLFNALNGKPTYVNEVNEWAQLSEDQIEALDDKGNLTNTTITIGDTDTNPGNYVDTDSYWDKYIKSKFENADSDLKNNTFFTINTKTRRKAGRALVDNIDDWFSWYKREEQPGVIANGNNDSPGGTPLCFAGPLLNEEYGCCINSDAVRSSTTLGPGESITIPIIVLYKTYEENGRDTASYSLGFDIRNNLYDSPLYYEVKFTAKYHSNVTDAVSSQKASIQESTKYNVTVR